MVEVFPAANRTYVSLLRGKGGNVSERSYVDSTAPLFYDWSVFGTQSGTGSLSFENMQMMFVPVSPYELVPYADDTRFTQDGFVSLSPMKCFLKFTTSFSMRFMVSIRIFSYQDNHNSTMILSRQYLHDRSGTAEFDLDGIENYPIKAGENLLFEIEVRTSCIDADAWGVCYNCSCRLRYNEGV